MTKSDEDIALQQLVGRSLSSVEFVQDYFQLRFDGPTLNVMNPTSVTAVSRRSRTWDDQFRNALCGQINKEIRSVSVNPGQSLVLNFADGSCIEVSLRDEDYRCAEGVYFFEFANAEWGVI